MKKVAEIRDKSSSLVHGSLQELNQRCRTKLSLLVKLRQSTKQVRFYSVFIGFRSASKGVIASRDGVTRSRDFFHQMSKRDVKNRSTGFRDENGSRPTNQSAPPPANQPAGTCCIESARVVAASTCHRMREEVFASKVD